jgi:uncharacterized protein YjbJ (UPF0337 family)
VQRGAEDRAPLPEWQAATWRPGNQAGAAALSPRVAPIPGARIEGPTDMVDKDRIAGAAKQVKGTVKEVAGKITGDAKLQAEGRADKVEGKVQNAIGGAKDAVREALNDK